MKVFDDQENVMEVGQKAADFPIGGDLSLSGLGKGSRYSLSSGKRFEGVANRRLLLSSVKSGRDSGMRG